MVSRIYSRSSSIALLGKEETEGHKIEIHKEVEGIAECPMRGRLDQGTFDN